MTLSPKQIGFTFIEADIIDGHQAAGFIIFPNRDLREQTVTYASGNVVRAVESNHNHWRFGCDIGFGKT